MSELSKYNYEFFEKLPVNLYPRYLRKLYKEMMGKRLNLDNPQSFTEKIQWLKLNDNLPIKTTLADKIAVRDYVKGIIPDLKFPEVYTCASCFEELDFDKCPESFVIKTNHACRQMIKVLDKKEFFSESEKAKLEIYRKTVNLWLSRHFAFNSAFELQYKDIPRKVYAEEYITEGYFDQDYSDYKVNCFNGVPKYIEYYINHQAAIFDTEWNQLDFGYNAYPKYTGAEIKKPHNLSKMLEYAKILSKDFKFVRIDFFEHNAILYLSEITFTPSSGFMFFDSPKYDNIIGNILNL